MPIEQELKLGIALEDASKLRRRMASQPWPFACPPSRRKLTSTYFDTPELALRQAGYALRLRRAGRRGVLTLKGGGGTLAGLHQRHEWEWSHPAPVLTLHHALHAPDVPAALRELLAQQAALLIPIFTTTFTRQAWSVVLPDTSQAEIALDLGEIAAGKKVLPLSEVEIELKQGSPTGLYDAALALLESVTLMPDPVSKAERGYALFTDTSLAPSKATAVVIEAERTVGACFAQMLLMSLDQIQRNRQGVLADPDPEYLHQMRIGVRRARTVLHVFKPLLPSSVNSHIDAPLRAFNRLLGPARDWDVFMHETLPSIRQHFPDTPLLTTLQAAAKTSQTAQRQAVYAYLRAPDYARMMLTLARWVTQAPWQDQAQANTTNLVYAHAVLRRRWKKLRAAGRHFAHLSPVERHALRLECKRMRYAFDIFQYLYPHKRATAFRAHLVAMQDALGKLTDARMTTQLLATLIERTDNPNLLLEAGIVIGWVQHAAALEETRMRALWKTLRDSSPIW